VKAVKKAAQLKGVVIFISKKVCWSMNIPAKPLKDEYLPKRILVIRLQAMGDLVITLPYLQSLREQLPPSVKLDLLTR
jgi:hypothetical protein